jgi:hypothetical protein
MQMMVLAQFGMGQSREIFHVKPHFSFRDLDENRLLASNRIRIETMDYFLRNYRDQLRGVPESQLNAQHGTHFEPQLAHTAGASVQEQALI